MRSAGTQARRHAGTKRGATGFTLLEVLLAVALVAALFASMFAIVFNLLDARSRALDHAARRLAAAALIESVERDLMTCLVGDRADGSGLEGEATSLAILSRGVGAYLAERGTDDPRVLGDLQRSEYRFDESTGVIEARRAHDDDSDESWAPIGGPVYKVRFRYHDGVAWRDSFDSLAEDRLPEAVEVAVWLRPWPGAPERPEPEPGPLASEADQEPMRLTYDATGGFDDRAAALESDLDDFDEPRPDRVRVIAIPDATADDPYSRTPKPSTATVAADTGEGAP